MFRQLLTERKRPTGKRETMKLSNGMKLYHGTNACFEEIQIAEHSSPFRDFGEGFYLTSFFKQARSQAKRKARVGNSTYVYVYEVRGFDRMADNTRSTIDEDLQLYAESKIGSSEVISDLSKSGEWEQYCFKTEQALHLLFRINVVNVA